MSAVAGPAGDLFLIFIVLFEEAISIFVLFFSISLFYFFSHLDVARRKLRRTSEIGFFLRAE